MLSDIANTVATCVSALAACLATYLAARALKDNNEAKRNEFESARPYFTFSNFGLRRPTVAKALSSDKELLDPGSARIDGLIVNDGRRHASDVRGAFLILPIKENAATGVFPISIADDVAPKSEWHVGSALLSVLPADFSGAESSPGFYDPGFFVLVAVQYTDTLASQKHTQCSFMRWPGISKGVISGQLFSASREEKDLVLDRYSDFLRPYLDGHMPAPSMPPNNSFKPPLRGSAQLRRQAKRGIEDAWDEPDFDSGLIRRCRNNWSVPVCDLTNEALSTFLRQKFALQIVLPEGRLRLQANFTDDTELYPEELANAVEAAEASLANNSFKPSRASRSRHHLVRPG